MILVLVVFYYRIYDMVIKLCINLEVDRCFKNREKIFIFVLCNFIVEYFYILV